MTQFSETTRRQIADLCKKYCVKELRLFGSRARGEATDHSDYDLLVDLRPDAKISLLEYSSLQVDLEKLIGAKVDLVHKGGLKPLIRENSWPKPSRSIRTDLKVARPADDKWR